MDYRIRVPELNLKKRKLPAREVVVDSHVKASIELMRAANELRLAIATVEGHQVGCTIRLCNAMWRWELLTPIEITRYRKSGVLA
jgi:hypothetical protein